MFWILLSCTSESLEKSEVPSQALTPDTASDGNNTQLLTTYDEQFPPLKACETDKPPVVMLHGFLESGDSHIDHAQRFANNGHCLDQIYSFDWNTIEQNDALDELTDFIDEVLSLTGKDQIDLIGHSAGCALSLQYIESTENDGKVRKYVNSSFSSIEATTIAPMLNLYSDADMIDDGQDIEGAINVQISDNDHFQTITSEASFQAIYTFLYDTIPAKLQLPETSSETVEIWGKAVYLGDNQAITGATIEVYMVDSDTGLPLHDTPEYTQLAGKYGMWGPISVSTSTHYEFRLIPDNGPVIRHYFDHFQADNYMLRLRGLPTTGFAANLLSSIPFDDEQSSVLVTFSQRQALITGRDSLSIDEVEMITDERAQAEDTIIALFHYDDGLDQNSGEDPSTFGFFPFLAATDTYIPGDSNQTISVTLNDSTLNVPRYSSGVILTAQ